MSPTLRPMVRFARNLILLFIFAWSIAPVHAAVTLNVKTDCGATGLGLFNDAQKINQCIEAAAAAGGGIVRFPSGRYSSGTIELLSNVTLQLDSGAVIAAASGAVYDAPEFNPYDQYQDFGHSHFHNALIRGEFCTNVGITGNGIIDGNFKLRTNALGDTPSGYADKAISLRECDGVVLSGVTIRRGGHIAVLANGVTNMSITDVTVQADPSNQLLSLLYGRDGINLINSSHITVSNVTANGLPDDALAFKSDSAIGPALPTTDIQVSNSNFSSLLANALQFGSETCGDFSNISFTNIGIGGAGKAGIGITSNDGAVIDGISYNGVSMTRTAIPVFIKTANRARCPTPPRIGIIRNIALNNVTANNARSPLTNQEYTSTISGLQGTPIENITLNGVSLTVPGGHPASDASIVPPETNANDPDGQGTRPAFGWWMRHVQNIGFSNSQVLFQQNDNRPALIVADGTGITINSLLFGVGSASPYDFGFPGTFPPTIGAGTTSTAGAPPRIQ